MSAPLLIAVILGGAVLVVLALWQVAIWRRYYRIIKFREKAKAGDYCRINLNGKPVTAFIMAVWPDRRTVQVKHQGVIYKLSIHEIFP